MSSVAVTGIFFLCLTGGSFGAQQQPMEKRSILTYPPNSVLQVTIGVTLAVDLENNSGGVSLGLQQNANLPNESLPFFYPQEVVTAKKFSIHHHLLDVLNRYGFNGSECLNKMICQVAEIPLIEGLVEDVVSFILTPSKHRSIKNLREDEKDDVISMILMSENLGKEGANCSQAFPHCYRTPLDYVSSFVHL